MIHALNPESSFFLYNEPQAAMLLPSRKYYQYLSPRSHVILGADQLPVLTKGIPDIVIVSTDDYNMHPDLFVKYKTLKLVDSYLFLQKRL